MLLRWQGAGISPTCWWVEVWQGFRADFQKPLYCAEGTCMVADLKQGYWFPVRVESAGFHELLNLSPSSHALTVLPQIPQNPQQKKSPREAPVDASEEISPKRRPFNSSRRWVPRSWSPRFQEFWTCWLLVRNAGM